MPRSYLYLLVVTAGFTTLGVELSASRLLDPWFGNSLIVWASLIGLILLYLTVGYWLGGRVADRWPHPLVLLRLTGGGDRPTDQQGAIGCRAGCCRRLAKTGVAQQIQVAVVLRHKTL